MPHENDQPLVTTGQPVGGVDRTTDPPTFHVLDVDSEGRLITASSSGGESNVNLTEINGAPVGINNPLYVEPTGVGIQPTEDASDGTIGNAIPLVAGLSGAENPSGDLEPLQVNAQGALIVSATVGAPTGTQTVVVSGTSTVIVSGGTVDIAGTSTVTVAGSVTISGTPTVEVAGIVGTSTVIVAGVTEVSPTSAANTRVNPFFNEITDGTNVMGTMVAFGSNPGTALALNVNAAIQQGTVALAGTSTVTVAGTVTVAATGTQTVAVVGTSTVEVAGIVGTPTVEVAGILGTSTVTIAGAVTVAATGTQTVTVVGTSTVEVAGIAGTPTVEVAGILGTSTVEVAGIVGTSTVTIAGTVPVAATGTQTVVVVGTSTVEVTGILGTSTVIVSGGTVDIAGTSTVIVSGGTVDVAGTSTVTVAGTVTVAATGTQTVVVSGIVGTSTVEVAGIAGTSTVEVAGIVGTSTVTVAGTVTVAATGTQTVTVVGTSTVAIAGTSTVTAEATYNAAPIANPSNATLVPAQSDLNGNLKVMSGLTTQTLAPWTTSNFTLGQSFLLSANSGCPAILVQLDQNGSIAGGAVTFQGTYDGTNWINVYPQYVLDPSVTSFALVGSSYSFSIGTPQNKPILILTAGFQSIRALVGAAMTGTGAVVTASVTQLAVSPVTYQDIVGTPTVNVVGTSTVAIAGTSTVEVAGIVGTSTVEVAGIVGTSTVAVAGTSTVEVAGIVGTSTVAIAGTSTVEVAGIVGTSTVAIAGTSTVTAEATYNAAPIANPSNATLVPAQSDLNGNLKVMSGLTTQTLAPWTTSNFTLGQSFLLSANSGCPAILVQLDQNGSIAGGAVTFQGTYDGTNWINVYPQYVLDPSVTSFASVGSSYLFSIGTPQNKPILILTAGFQSIRALVGAAMTGTGAVVTASVTQLAVSPVTYQDIVGTPTVTVAGTVTVAATGTQTVVVSGIVGTSTVEVAGIVGTSTVAVAGTSTVVVTSQIAGPVVGGPAASSAVLTGLVYQTAAPSLTNSQQVSVQGDSTGNLRINPYGNVGSFINASVTTTITASATLQVAAATKWLSRSIRFTARPSNTVTKQANIWITDASGNVMWETNGPVFTPTNTVVYETLLYPSGYVSTGTTVAAGYIASARGTSTQVITLGIPEMYLGPSFQINAMLNGAAGTATYTLSANVLQLSD